MIDKTKISGFQFTLLIVCLLTSSSILTSFVSMVLMHESWIAAVLSIVIIMPAIYLYKKLIERFPKQNLFEIFEIVYGKFVGKVLSFACLFYFIVVALLNFSDMVDFSRLTLMNKTPGFVIVGLSVLISGIAVSKGIKLISRYTTVFLAFAIFNLLITTFLLFNQFDFSNFLPILSQKPIRYLQGTHLMVMIPLGEFMMFLMFTKNVQIKPKQWGKYMFWGFFVGILILLLVKIRDIAVLGNIYHILSLPQLVSLKLVSVGDALSRMEVLFSVVLVLLLYFKTTIMIYVITISISHLFKVGDFKKMIPTVCFMIIILTAIFENFNSEEHLTLGRESYPFISGFFQSFIPILTLILAVLFKKTTNKGFGKKNSYLKGENFKKFAKLKPKVFSKEVKR